MDDGEEEEGALDFENLLVELFGFKGDEGAGGGGEGGVGCRPGGAW